MCLSRHSIISAKGRSRAVDRLETVSAVVKRDGRRLDEMKAAQWEVEVTTRVWGAAVWTRQSASTGSDRCEIQSSRALVPSPSTLSLALLSSTVGSHTIRYLVWSIADYYFNVSSVLISR